MKNVKQIVIPALALFLICLVATFLLGETDALTKDKIAQVAQQAADSARLKVCDSAASFAENTVSVNDKQYTYYTALDESGNTVGFAVTTTDKSYGGLIEVMTGFDAQGDITGVEILTISDTPGLGMKAKNDGFRDLFKGKSGQLTVSKTATADNEIQAITGATITSKAVTRCVNLATEILNQAKAGVN